MGSEWTQEKEEIFFMNQFRAPTSTLSERMRADEHAPNCHSVTDTDGHCTCYLGRWADEVEALETRVAELVIELDTAMVIRNAHAALDSGDFIDAEEAFTRLEISDLGDNRTVARAYYKPRPLIAPKIHGRRSALPERGPCVDCGAPPAVRCNCDY